MERRDLMKMLATMPMGALALAHSDIADAAEHVHKLMDEREQNPQAKPYVPKWFQPLEWRTARVLADILFPRDARSGSATDAGVPEFLDYVVVYYPGHQPRMREGLGWMNAESRARFGVPFPDAKPAQRIAIVEDIAWPAKAKPEHLPGVRFFNAFRDLCAGGFYTSRIGVKDIGYMGNVPQAAWTGCPSPAKQKLGVE